MGRRIDSESFIYILRDPTRISRRVYVGWSPYPRKRLVQHISDSRSLVSARGSRLLHDWIRSLLARSVRPCMDVIETIPAGGDWEAAETFWISYLKEIVPLANLTRGGDGAAGSKHSADSRARRRTMTRARPVSATNRTGFKGVKVNRGRFRANLTLERTHAIGSYATAIEAAVAYDRAARAAWGADAALNFPFPGEKSARPGVEPQQWQGLPDVRVRLAGDPVLLATGWRGVHRVKTRYQARFRMRHLGLFATPEEAARAYDAAAKQALGARARLNFPDHA